MRIEDKKKTIPLLSKDLSKRLVIQLKRMKRCSKEEAPKLQERLTNIWEELLERNELSFLLSSLTDYRHLKQLIKAVKGAIQETDLEDDDDIKYSLEDALQTYKEEEHTALSDSGEKASAGIPAHMLDGSKSSSNETSRPLYVSALNPSRLITKRILAEIEEGEYTQEKKSIAKGSFGKIYRGSWKGFEVAIKQLKTGQGTDTLARELKKEALLLAKVRSPYVVHLHGVCMSYPYRLILEYCAGGSLYQLLQSKAEVTWARRWQLGQDVAQGVASLHQHDVIHQDLAARNVLLTQDGRAKLTDFGLSEVKNLTAFSMTTQGYLQRAPVASLPWAWSAPERLANQQSVTTFSDVYSYGMVLWEITSRMIPYFELRKQHTAEVLSKQIREGHLRETIPTEAPAVWQQLISACWREEPEQRPRMIEVVARLTIGQLQTLGLVGSYSQHATADKQLEQLQHQNSILSSQLQEKSIVEDQLNQQYQAIQQKYSANYNALQQAQQQIQSLNQTSSQNGQEQLRLESKIKRLQKKLEMKKVELASTTAELTSARERRPNKRSGSPQQQALPTAQHSRARLWSQSPQPRKNTNQLSAVEQVKSMAQSVSQQVRAEDVTALLNWVAKGHLRQVEKLLSKNSKLALATGTVKDLSDRTFSNITVFQYAAWALDIEMCEVILKYLKVPTACVQLKALEETPQAYGAHGAHCDFTPLIRNTQKYLDNIKQWAKDDKSWKYGGEEKAEYCLQKEVGGAQRQCPAWFWYLWTEKGKNVAWMRKDLSLGFTRDYSVDVKNYGLSWVFFYKAWNSPGPGVGQWGYGAVVRHLSGTRCEFRYHHSKSHNAGSEVDLVTAKRCIAQREKQFSDLRLRLTTEYQQQQLTTRLGM